MPRSIPEGSAGFLKAAKCGFDKDANNQGYGKVMQNIHVVVSLILSWSFEQCWQHPLYDLTVAEKPAPQ